MKKYLIAVDFDGTIVEQDYPFIGKLRKGAKEYINKLYEEHYVIIWTCRNGVDLLEMKSFLIENDIKYHTINENINDIVFKELAYIPYPKIFAHYYIDDRNLGKLKSWKKIYKKITRRKS